MILALLFLYCAFCCHIFLYLMPNHLLLSLLLSVFIAISEVYSSNLLTSTISFTTLLFCSRIRWGSGFWTTFFTDSLTFTVCQEFFLTAKIPGWILVNWNKTTVEIQNWMVNYFVWKENKKYNIVKYPSLRLGMNLDTVFSKGIYIIWWLIMCLFPL